MRPEEFVVSFGRVLYPRVRRGITIAGALLALLGVALAFRARTPGQSAP